MQYIQGWIRFIPAPAGNTLPSSPSRFGPPVHPRACGEHERLFYLIQIIGGSSPRLRGTRSLDRARMASRRFIPAPAGNTAPSARSSAWSAVHPRACGEHINRISIKRKKNGSSPRLRGTLPRTGSRDTSCRFIPASAGNTNCVVGSFVPSTVHPRACGEHKIGLIIKRQFGGSSPRLRGTP